MTKADVHIITTSDSLGWQGIQLEEEFVGRRQADEVTVNGHYLMMNMSDADFCFEMRGDADWESARLSPQQFWINPEGRPFSVRHATESHYASCTIDGRYLDSLAGCHFELDAGVAITDAVLAGLFQALLAIAKDRARYSPALAAEVIRAFVNAVAARHGHPAAEMTAKGGLAPNQIKSLLAWLQEHIEQPLTVSAMAAQVGLSAAHFAREFKRSTGSTPWDYVVNLRVENARDSLIAGDSFAAVASRFGFSDQSHMARLFKLRYGVSPSAYLKASKR